MNNIALKPTIELNVDDQENSRSNEKDAAWASINTPLHIDSLLVFIQDVERLFKINPMLEFKQWETLGASCYIMTGRNLSQETPFDFNTKLHVTHKTNGMEIEYENGIKSHTTIEIEPIELENGKQGSKLTIIDSYSEIDNNNALVEVDKSLVIWVTDLQRYLINWRRWSSLKLWRWYMQRVWLPMKPTARRITYMLLWISVVEVALITLGVAIYLAEYA